MEARVEAQTLAADARDELDGISHSLYLMALTSALTLQESALDADTVCVGSE